jgi:pimeloyl-ACP methyl ester carboxylesterase
MERAESWPLGNSYGTRIASLFPMAVHLRYVRFLASFLSIILALWPQLGLGQESVRYTLEPSGEAQVGEKGWLAGFSINFGYNSSLKQRDGFLLARCANNDAGSTYHLAVAIGGNIIWLTHVFGNKCRNSFPLPMIQKNANSYTVFYDSPPIWRLAFGVPVGFRSEFEQLDAKLMDNLRGKFHPTGDGRHLQTLSLQHGKPTDIVYVFVPGIALSLRYFLQSGLEAFQAGHNVIVGVLPGYEDKSSLRSSAGQAAEWYLYGEALARVAKQYGRKVVFVGMSTGANLAIRAAELGLIDGAILFQPLIATSFWASRVLDVASFIKLPEQSESALQIARHAQALSRVTYTSISRQVRVQVMLSKTDFVVSNSATLQWVKRFAPHAEVSYHPIEDWWDAMIWGHMQRGPIPLRDFL